MPLTLLSMINAQKSIMAYGTSEGASKGWDARGRGRSVREATAKFPVWRSLNKAGFKEVGQRRNDVRTFTANLKAPPSRFDGYVSNYHHRIDVKDDGSWRHTKGPVGTDIAVGRVHGRDFRSLAEHLNGGKFQTSFRNEGHSSKWEGVPEAR